MSRFSNYLFAVWASSIVLLSILPGPVISVPNNTGGLLDLFVGITATSDNPMVGEYVGFDFQLSNNGNNSASFNYSVCVENLIVKDGQGVILQAHESQDHFGYFGWAFDNPGTYQVRINITEVNGDGEIGAVKNVTVKANKSFFRWSSGSLKPLRAIIRLEPCDNKVGFFMHMSLVNTGDSTLVVNYEQFGGFGQSIGNGSKIEVPPMRNNWGYLNYTSWGADPTGNGMYPLGINISDVNGTGRLVQYLVITVNEFSGNGTGPLCGVVCVQPEANVGECVTVRVLLSNVGNTTLYDISYLISAGLGNSVASGYLGELLPGALCQSAPDGIVELRTEWTPSSGGIYLAAINASDYNSSAVFAGGVEVAVSGPGMGRLATVIQIGSDAVELGENITIRCILRNIGYAILYNVHYEIYAGFGNQLMKGIVAELSSGALCQSAPASMVVLNATWTPTEIGAYEVGINASDANGTSFVATHVSKIVNAPSGVIKFSILPVTIDAFAGGSVNATVSLWYGGYMMSMRFQFSTSSSIPGLGIHFGRSSDDGCRIDRNSSTIFIQSDIYRDFNVSLTIPLGTADGIYLFNMSIQSFRENLNAMAQIKVRVHNVPPIPPEISIPEKPASENAYAGYAVAAMVGVAALAIVGSTEFGLVALFSLFLPLYSKIRKDDVLDQFTRGKIQGYITAYPGEHYNSIKTQLGLNNGVLAYHLRVLEREGFVTSLRDGVYKRFYPKDTPLPKKRGQFSAIQDMIIENIRETPGISQDGLARKMKVSNQVIYYHIRTLIAAGAVRLEKAGKDTHCYLNNSGDSGSYAGVSF